jgi:hypothetical protein
MNPSTSTRGRPDVPTTLTVIVRVADVEYVADQTMRFV